jgi:hypothetical protein
VTNVSNCRLSVMRKLSAVILFIFCLTLTPTARSQGTYTAASCSQSDVNKIINGPTHVAVNGDIINIPAGSCVWTAGITVPGGIGISIIGSGTPNTSPGTVGAGTSTTIITDQTSSTGLFLMNPTFGNSLSRISLLELIPSSSRTGNNSPINVIGKCTSSGCPNLRLDNLTVPAAWSGVGISDATFAVVANMFGVADHNTIGGGSGGGGNGVDFINVAHGNWMGVGSWGDNSWASPDTFGTNQEFYLENNNFISGFGTDTDRYGPIFGGGRYACRYNSFSNPSGSSDCTNHGTDTIGRTRGARQAELYGNTTTCGTTTNLCNTIFGFRSAVGIIWGNSFTGFSNTYFTVDPQRRWRPDSPWGNCDGNSPWDTNDGVTYHSGTIGSVTSANPNYVLNNSDTMGWSPINKWVPNGAPYSFWNVTRGNGFEINASTANSITVFDGAFDGLFGIPVPQAGDTYQILRATVCMDQPTRGAGLLVEGGDGTLSTEGHLNPILVSTGNPGPVNEALDPTYEFADSGTPGHGQVGSGSSSIIANRDYYAQNVKQTAQTSPTSPFDGTSGTGYGTLANRPMTCAPRVGYWATDQGNWNQSGTGGQGELFVCDSTNHWTPYYTPYTYPHPLITSGTKETGGAPSPPTGLTVVVK